MYSYNAKMVHVVDGDTMDFMVDLGFNISYKMRVRLLGIDTSEIYHPTCKAERQNGLQAKAFVIAMFLNKSGILNTYKDKTGKYGRYLADFTKDTGVDLVAALKQAGFAKLEKWKR